MDSLSRTPNSALQLLDCLETIPKSQKRIILPSRFFNGRPGTDYVDTTETAFRNRFVLRGERNIPLLQVYPQMIVGLLELPDNTCDYPWAAVTFPWNGSQILTQVDTTQPEARFGRRDDFHLRLIAHGLYDIMQQREKTTDLLAQLTRTEA